MLGDNCQHGDTDENGNTSLPCPIEGVLMNVDNSQIESVEHQHISSTTNDTRIDTIDQTFRADDISNFDIIASNQSNSELGDHKNKNKVNKMNISVDDRAKDGFNRGSNDVIDISMDIEGTTRYQSGDTFNPSHNFELILSYDKNIDNMTAQNDVSNVPKRMEEKTFVNFHDESNSISSSIEKPASHDITTSDNSELEILTKQNPTDSPRQVEVLEDNEKAENIFAQPTMQKVLNEIKIHEETIEYNRDKSENDNHVQNETNRTDFTGAEICEEIRLDTRSSLNVDMSNDESNNISSLFENRASLTESSANDDIPTSNIYLAGKATQMEVLEDDEKAETVPAIHTMEKDPDERKIQKAIASNERYYYQNNDKVQNETTRSEFTGAETYDVRRLDSQSKLYIDTQCSNDEDDIIQQSLLAARMFMFNNMSKFSPNSVNFRNPLEVGSFSANDQLPNIIVQTKLESMSTLLTSSNLDSSRNSFGIELDSIVSSEDKSSHSSTDEESIDTDIEANSILPYPNKEPIKSTSNQHPIKIGEVGPGTTKNLFLTNDLVSSEAISIKSCESTGSHSMTHFWDALQKEIRNGGLSNGRKFLSRSRITLSALLALFVVACVLTFSSIFTNDGKNEQSNVGTNAYKKIIESSAPSQIPTANRPGIQESTSSTSPSINVPISNIPTVILSSDPSIATSNIPSTRASKIPSTSPFWIPSISPSGIPSTSPSGISSTIPSGISSTSPSDSSSTSPSIKVTNLPSQIPSISLSPFHEEVFSDFSFYVMGDIPYNDYQQNLLNDHLKEISSLQQSGKDSSDFIVHVGDLKQSQENCTETKYISVNKIFKTKSTIPILTVPGDNDWNDCQNPVQAWNYFEKHFIGLEHEWGNSSIASIVQRSSKRPENFVFWKSGILFLGINMVAGNAEKSQRSQRIIDNEEWMHISLEKYKNNLRAIIIFGHSTVGSKIFGSIKQKVEPLEIPLLYINGNIHYHQMSKELNYPSAPLMWKHFWRIQLDAGAFAPPMKITIRGNDGKTKINDFLNVTEYQTVIANDLVKVDRRQIISYFVRWS